MKDPALPAMPFNPLTHTLSALNNLAQHTGCAILLCRSITTRPADLLDPRLLGPRPLDLLSIPDPFNPDHFLLRPHRTAYPSPAPLLCYTIEPNTDGIPTLRWLDPPPDYLLPPRSITTRALSAQRLAILRYLRPCAEPQSIRDIADALHTTRSATSRTLQRMCEDHQIGRSPASRYFHPQSPAALIAASDPPPFRGRLLKSKQAWKETGGEKSTRTSHGLQYPYQHHQNEEGIGGQRCLVQKHYPNGKRRCQGIYRI